MDVFKGFLAFREMINKEIIAIRTSQGNLYEDSLSTLKIDLTLQFVDFDLLLYCDDYITGFIENEAGDVFYNLKTEIKSGTIKTGCQKRLDFGIVDHIKVFRRKLDLDDEHRNLSWVQKTFGSLEYVKDLFLIVSENGKKLLIAFHPFFAGIEAFFTSKSISDFFEEYEDVYTLDQEIR